MTDATPAANEKSAPPAGFAASAISSASAWIGKARASIGAGIPVSRAALMAAGLGFVAGAGLLTGTIAAMGVGDLFASPTPQAAPWTATVEETRALKQTIRKLDARIAELKAGIAASNRHASSQRSQIDERSRQSAHAQTEMQTRLAKIGDAVERLEKRVTAAVAGETTGSVAPRYAAAAAAMQPPPAEATAPPKPEIAAGWTIRHASHGRALVFSGGRVFEAAPGLHLPGLGRVEAVARRNGRWAVITEGGIIMARWRPQSAYGFAD